MGERSFLATTAALLARALVQQGKHAEALAPVELAEEGAAADDLSSQVLWRSVKACVLAERGELEEAERLSSEAVAIADGTDWINDRADAWLERAQVLRAAGRAEEAVGAARTARELYERKGNEVGAGRALAVEHPA
jgi:ATP/maltotriose-dependent transcriptional regulator MalT